MTPSRRWWLAGATAFGAAAAGGWLANRRTTVTSEDDTAAVHLLYAQKLPDHAGTMVSLDTFKGRTVVLNFWATWCPPCIDEMPELAELHREIAPNNGTVVGIGIDSPSNIREFADKHRLPYPLLVAGMAGSELSRKLGNTSAALPFTVVIDRSGHVVDKKLGRIKFAVLRERVLAALKR
jgi:peroxiredoxin